MLLKLVMPCQHDSPSNRSNLPELLIKCNIIHLTSHLYTLKMPTSLQLFRKGAFVIKVPQFCFKILEYYLIMYKKYLSSHYNIFLDIHKKFSSKILSSLASHLCLKTSLTHLWFCKQKSWIATIFTFSGISWMEGKTFSTLQSHLLTIKKNLWDNFS